ncbi:MAG TPA: sigma-70 family RNA polymerase sigma factor [Roseiflexaceae bacterium]|nr:sigma-70 family RNA polymerase sigma factor [Roseiflexaceae bacterium]
MEPSDAELVLGCRRGEEAAWDALVGRYQRPVTAIARRAGLDAEQAADVLQRVLTALVEQLDRIEHPELIGAWLLTAARREAWRQRRRERTAGGTLDDLARGGEASNGPAPDEDMLRSEERDAVQTALNALDERCRRLLMLLFERPDPPSYAAIAASLGVGEGSIGPTRARCLEKLRRLLSDLET